MAATRINNIDSGLFVRKPRTTTTFSPSFATVTVTPTSPIVGGAVNDVQSRPDSSHNSDSSIFLAIGLIVGFTVIGCVLACLYRRRKARKITTVRSFWDLSVGSGTMSRKHLESNEGKPDSTPVEMEVHTTKGSTATDEEDAKVGIAPGLQEEEEPSFSKMKLPPTIALPPLPNEAQRPSPIHYRSVSSPNVRMNRNTRITNVERTKSLGQSTRGLSKSKFNFPPPPSHPPKLPTSHHSNPIITNSATHDSEFLTFTPTSSISNDYVIRVTPPSLPTSQTPFTKSTKFSSTSNVYEKSVYSDNDENTSKNGVGAFPTPLPKVELVNANLSINFDQLSIFNDYSVGVGEEGDHNGQAMTRDGAENVQVLLVNNNKLYNEYI